MEEEVEGEEEVEEGEEVEEEVDVQQEEEVFQHFCFPSSRLNGRLLVKCFCFGVHFCSSDQILGFQPVSGLYFLFRVHSEELVSFGSCGVAHQIHLDSASSH